MADELHTRLVQILGALRRSDGGFSTSLDGQSEVEPTAVAALALPGDAKARRWLGQRQQADGGFGENDGRATGPTTGAIAAFGLPPGAAARALAYATAHRGLPLPNAPDPDRRYGWGWTSDTRSLVEPTARVLLAESVLRPRARAVRREAIAFLRERHCSDGGWNFGNASVYDVDLRSYPQTTAIALVALQRDAEDVIRPAIHYLAEAWPSEPGGLTIAQTLLAFRVHGVDAELAPLAKALDRASARSSFRERPLTVAWAAIATAPDESLAALRWRA